MADLSKTVEVIFGAKYDDLTKGISQIEGSFGKAGGSITNMTGPLDSITNKIMAAEAAFFGLAAGAMTLAVTKAAEFDGSFKLISTRINASSQDIGKFREDILTYSQGSSKSLSDINASIDEAVRKGIPYQDSIALLGITEKLAVASHSELAVSTNLLVSTMNAYGASSKDAEHYADVLFQTTRIGKVDIPQLADGLAQLTGMAKAGGIPLETLCAAIAALTQTGLPAETAIAGLKNVLLKLEAPSAEASKLAQKLGISYGSAAVQTQGFEVVLQKAYKATGGNVEMMKELFGGVRGFNVAAILGADSAGKFSEDLKLMAIATGVVAREWATMAKGFGDVNQNLKNNMDVLLIDFGHRILPLYKDIAVGLVEMFKGIKIGLDSGAFDPLFKYLDVTGKSIADWLNQVAKVFPEAMKDIDFSGLIRSFGGLGESVKKALENIFKDMDVTTPEGLHKVIQRVIDGLAALTNMSKGVVEGMTPMFKLIGEGIDKFTELDESGAGLVGTILGVAKSINILADYSGTLTAVLTLLSGKALIDTSLAVWKLGASLIGIGPAITTMVGTMGLVEFGAIGMAAAFGIALGSILNQNETVQKYSQSLLALLDINKDFFGAQGKTKEEMAEVNKKFDAAVAKHKELTAGTGATTTATTEYQKAVNALNLKKGLEAFDELNASLKKTRDTLELNGKIKNIDVIIKATADGASIEKAYGMIIEKFPDGSTRIVQAQATLDKIALDNAKAKIEEAIPKEKQFEIQAKIDEAKIKGQADIIQKAIEWKAKLDIAEVEAGAKKFEAIFKSIDNTVSSTGTTLTGLFDSLVQMQGKGGTGIIEQQIEDENRRRSAALEMQKELTGAQIAQIKAQTAALQKGDSIIKIDGAGLQPHLEAFMFEILRAIQIRANAEGQKFLVGL
ncbi:MAG: phage tail tape measure protein [Syntrophus sp. (in: bacteria)]